MNDPESIKKAYEKETGQKWPDRFQSTKPDPGISMRDIAFGLLLVVLVVLVYSCS